MTKRVGQLSAASTIAPANDLMAIEQSGELKQGSTYNIVEAAVVVSSTISSINGDIASVATNLTSTATNLASTASNLTSTNSTIAVIQGDLNIIGLTFGRCEVTGVTLPALSSAWSALDGQIISDAASVFNALRVPNVNGANVVLTLTFTATAGGATATVLAADRAAIAIHDWVTGTGIAALTYVKSFNYSTGALVISDAAATGSKSTTFTNDGRAIIGSPSTVAFGSQGDQLQGHRFDWLAHTNSAGFVNDANTRKFFGNIDTAVAHNNQPAITTDGVNGTPRTGNKTRQDAYKMRYYMRIK